MSSSVFENQNSSVGGLAVRCVNRRSLCGLPKVVLGVYVCDNVVYHTVNKVGRAKGIQNVRGIHDTIKVRNRVKARSVEAIGVRIVFGYGSIDL